MGYFYGILAVIGWTRTTVAIVARIRGTGFQPVHSFAKQNHGLETRGTNE
jgi:hypothetical protein